MTMNCILSSIRFRANSIRFVKIGSIFPSRISYRTASSTGDDIDAPRSDPYQMEHFRHSIKRYIPSEGDTRDIGPYPDLPKVSDQLRPRYPDIPYDDPQLRRYRGEPIQEDGDVLSMWFPDVSSNYSIGFMLKGVIGFFGTIIILCYISFKYDDPYTRAIAVPRTLYIDDPVIRQLQYDNAFLTHKPWSNTKDYMVPPPYEPK